MCFMGLYLVVELTLGLALRLGLAGQRKVGELELGALRVGPEQLRFLRVQEGERLRARPVRLHTHLFSGSIDRLFTENTE